MDKSEQHLLVMSLDDYKWYQSQTQRCVIEDVGPQESGLWDSTSFEEENERFKTLNPKP